MKKRPIAEVRKEIWALTNELTHHIITEVALMTGQQSKPKSERRKEIERRLEILKAVYPKWEKTQRPK